MAITATQRTEIVKVIVGLFDAAPGAVYLNEFTSFAGNSAGLVSALVATPAFQAIYPTFLTSEEFAAKFVDNLVGSAAAAADKAWAANWIAGRLNAGESRADVVADAIAALDAVAHDNAIWGAAAEQFDNQVAVAEYYSVQAQGDATDVGTLQSVIAGVDADTDVSTDAAKAAVIDAALGSTPVTGFTLTDGIDTVVGNALDNIISAPVVQNQNGELMNTLETGDSITGGDGMDTLNVVLTNSQSADDDNDAPAISAVTSGVEVVNVRSQYFDNDGVNSSHIDAELMAGVEQYWSDNSRADLQIEDVRQLPEELTFGMRQTDPGVSYSVYFDPAQLAEDRGQAGDSSLTLTLVDNTDPAAELANFSINGVGFTLDGVEYRVVSDDLAAADTYAEFAAALQAALAAEPALAALEVTLNANNTITVVDPAGATFGTLGFSWVDNLVPASGNLSWNQAVGAAVVTEEPITTDVVLDAVGRTSQGGTLDIGSMADGGIEVFNVAVDRSSWLTAMESREDFGAGDRHLETVNLSSMGANGDLKVGDEIEGTTGELDGRVEGGLTDVREVLDAGFLGDLTLGIELTEDSIGRYLDAATGEVQFTYEGADGNDNFNIVVDADLASDPDFAMDVNMGAGDDRLNLDVATASNVSVDGGTGTNTIAVSRSHGTTAANTFEGFANFQVYEVEGADDTSHDFTSMASVTTVNVATEGGADTRLIDLNVAEVTVTGKNQTLGNNSNADQSFDDIRVSGTDGATLSVVLDNTARINGELVVDDLIIDDFSAANLSAVRTLEIESAGRRSTSNVINNVNAAMVNTFNLVGTQDLDVTITAAANSTDVSADRASLVVNGAALTGDLELEIDGGVVSAVDGGATSTVTLTGTAGAADRLTLSEANGDNTLAITVDTTVSGFETVRLLDANGEMDITNFSGVALYDLESVDGALVINGMRGNEVVQVNTDLASVEGNDLTFVAAGQATSNVLDLNFVDADTDTDEAANDFTNAGANQIFVQDFRTIALDLGGEADVDEAYTFDLNLMDENGVEDADLAYVAADVYARTVTVTGGGDQGDAGVAGGVDSVDLGTLTNVLTDIDLSGYVGQVTLALDVFDEAVLDRNTTIEVNGYGFTYTETDLGVDSHITTFVFNADAVEDTENWSITGFDAFNALLGGVDLTNLSVLDLSALGVTGLADINVVDVAGNATITSNAGLNFEITLVGVTAAELSNENFDFA